MMKNNYKKNFIWNSIGSTMNAFNSLFFMIIVTRMNNLDIAGIFSFAFSTATLFNIIGIYSGRVYQVTDNDKITYKDYFINKVITCSFMILVTLIFLLYKNYSLSKGLVIFILCFLKMLEAMGEYFYAYFQKNDELYKVGISLTIKNILMLIIFLVTELLTKNIIISSLSLIISYLVIMIFYDFRLFDFSLLKQKLNLENLKNIFIKGFFTFALTFLNYLILNFPRYIIDSNMSDDYSAIFGILIMPATVMILLSQFILQPSIMDIKKSLDKNDKIRFNDVVKKMFLMVSVLSILVVLGAYLLGIPVLELIYNLDLKEYKLSLLIIIIGSCFYSYVVIISNILISMRNTFSQVVCYFVAILSSYLLCTILIDKYRIYGASCAYAFVMFEMIIFFIILYLYTTKKFFRGDKHEIS